jgi:Oligosaccharyltransferase subunit Ribophorin II
MLTSLLQSQKDIPVQLLLSTKPLQASVVIASFGSAQGLIAPVFDLELRLDSNAPPPTYEAPLRYGKRPEIHHTFNSDPRSPPKVISLFFALAVVAAVPALFIGVSYAPSPFTLSTASTNVFASGPFSVQTSTTYPRLSVLRLCRMPRSLVPSWPWSLFSSCTTPAGTFSRPCPSLASLGL